MFYILLFSLQGRCSGHVLRPVNFVSQSKVTSRRTVINLTYTRTRRRYKGGAHLVFIYLSVTTVCCTRGRYNILRFYFLPAPIKSQRYSPTPQKDTTKKKKSTVHKISRARVYVYKLAYYFFATSDCCLCLKLRHGKANGGYIIFNILNKTHTITYFNNKHVNTCFTV